MKTVLLIIFILGSFYSIMEIIKPTNDTIIFNSSPNKKFNFMKNEAKQCLPGDIKIDNSVREQLEMRKKFFDKTCNSSQEDFEKELTLELSNQNEIQFLAQSLDRTLTSIDFYHLGCYNYDKITFIEDIYKSNLKNILNSKPVVYQYFYYLMKFFHVVIHIPILLLFLLNFGILSFFELVLSFV